MPNKGCQTEGSWGKGIVICFLSTYCVPGHAGHLHTRFRPELALQFWEAARLRALGEVQPTVKEP